MVVPTIGTCVGFQEEHIKLINEADSGRAFVSFDWVTDCVEQDKLLELPKYKLTPEELNSFDDSETLKDQDEDHQNARNAICRTTSPEMNNNSDQELLASTNASQTTDIASIIRDIENTAYPEAVPDRPGKTNKAIEVPEEMMDAFSWLEDKFHQWGKSDFGGSLAGFFTRVKMQVSL